MVTSDICSRPLTPNRKKGCQASLAGCIGQNNKTMSCRYVVMFSAVVTMLTAPVWLLSGTISAVDWSFSSSQLSLMNLEAPVLCRNTTLHHSADIKQLRNSGLCYANAILRDLVHTYVLHTHFLTFVQTTSVHTDVRRGPVISGLNPISSKTLFADSDGSVTSFIFQARTTSRLCWVYGAEVSIRGGSGHMGVKMWRH